MEIDILKEWYTVQRFSALQRNLEIRSKDALEFLAYLDPFSRPYFSNLNPTFLFSGTDLEEHNDQYCLARDGMVSLFWYFERHSAPGKFKGTLLIRPEAYSIVPEAWKPLVGTYRFARKPWPGLSLRRPSQFAERLLLAGINAPAFITPELLDQELPKIDRAMRKISRRKDYPVDLFLPMKADFVSSSRDSSDRNEVLRRILEFFQGKVRFITFPELNEKYQLKKYAFAELNTGSIYADSFILHLAASKGAHVLESESETHWNRWDEFFPTSLQYGFYVRGPKLYRRQRPRKNLNEANRALAERAEMLRSNVGLLESAASTLLPWSSWYRSQIRSSLIANRFVPVPKFISRGPSLLPVKLSGLKMNIDEIRENGTSISIIGWSYDPDFDGVPDEIQTYIGPNQVGAAVQTFPRPDLLSILNERGKHDRYAGFEISIPSETLSRRVTEENPLALLAISQGRIATVIGMFGWRDSKLVQLPVSLQSTLDLDLVSLAEKSLMVRSSSDSDNVDVYPLLRTETGLESYVGFVDHLEVRGNKLVVDGWCLETAHGYSPDAVAAFQSTKCVGLISSQLKRDDVGERFGFEKMFCGFQGTLNAPDVTSTAALRVFALFGHVAVELGAAKRTNQ